MGEMYHPYPTDLARAAALFTEVRQRLAPLIAAHQVRADIGAFLTAAEAGHRQSMADVWRALLILPPRHRLGVMWRVRDAARALYGPDHPCLPGKGQDRRTWYR